MMLGDMLAGAGINAPRGGPEILGLAADSRAIRPGFLFAALPGAKADGRAFIAEAVARGAVAVLAPPGTEWPPGVPPRPLLADADPRAALARMAAAFHRVQPDTCVAVTGTNGKTSTVEFLRLLWAAAGCRSASLGTLGLVAEGFPTGPSLTTPDPIALHAMLAALAKGAAMPGSQGAADRSMLLRLIGHASSTAGEKAKAARTLHVHVGERVMAAMDRRQAAVGRVIEGQIASVGRDPVTAPSAIERKP